MNSDVYLRVKPACYTQYDNISSREVPEFHSDGMDLNPAFWGECVTMKFDKAKFMMTQADGDTKCLDANGTFYVIANVSSDSEVVDEIGNLYENDSLFIGGLKNTDFLPIDNGGKLVLYMKEPGWPVDVHMVVLESGDGTAPVEQLIRQANTGSRISLLFKGKN
jgi:hypothetical protein